MRKWILVLCVLLFGGVAMATPPDNGDFETGDLTYWTADEAFGCDEFCLVEVNEYSARYGDYGLETWVDGEHTSTFQYTWAESDLIDVPTAATTVLATFLFKVDGAFPELPAEPTGPSFCQFDIVQDLTLIGRMTFNQSFTLEWPDGVPPWPDPVDEDTWISWQFESDLDGWDDDVHVRLLSWQRGDNEGDMRCLWDNVVLSFGFF